MISKTQGRIFLTIITVSLFAFSSAAFSQTRSQVYGSDITKQTMTAYVQGDLGMVTFESEAAASKETNQTSTWTIGTYAGEARNLGISIRSSENVVPFELNESKMGTNWRDVFLKWRLGWVTPGIATGLSEVNITKDDAKLVDLYARSIGAGLELNIPLFDKAVFHASNYVFSSPTAWDKNAQDVELDKRTETDIGASIDLTEKVIDLVVGYRTRAYNLKIDGVEYQEKNQGAYTGLRFGLYF